MRDGPVSGGACSRLSDDVELRRIAATGRGFVIDPFNRRFHRADCERLASLTTGEPKWFAENADALNAYAAASQSSYPESAEPLQPCGACGDSLSSPVKRAAAQADLRRSRGDDGPSYDLEAGRERVLALADVHVPFEPRAGGEAAQLRADLRGALAGAPLQQVRRLARFACRGPTAPIRYREPSSLQRLRRTLSLGLVLGGACVSSMPRLRGA